MTPKFEIDSGIEDEVEGNSSEVKVDEINEVKIQKETANSKVTDLLNLEDRPSNWPFQPLK